MPEATPDPQDPGNGRPHQGKSGPRAPNLKTQRNNQDGNGRSSYQRGGRTHHKSIIFKERKARTQRRKELARPLALWQNFLKAIGIRKTRHAEIRHATKRGLKNRQKSRVKNAQKGRFSDKGKAKTTKLKDLHEFLLRRASNQVGDLTPMEIPVRIDHARLNHWLGAAEFIFNVCHLLEVRPCLIRGRKRAFGKHLNQILEDGLASRRDTAPIVYRSSPAGFFGPDGFHETFKLWMLDNGLCPPNAARRHLADELSPIFNHFADGANRQKLVNRIKSSCGIPDLPEEWETLHLRRGDLTVLFAREFQDTPLSEFFRDEVFCYHSGLKSWAFTSEASIDNKKEEIGHAALRIENQRNFQCDYSDVFNRCHQTNRTLFIFTDGYTKASMGFKGISSCPFPVREIETIMTDVLIPLPKEPKSIRVAGEDDAYLALSFSDLLHVSVTARKVTCVESGFPISFVNLFNVYQDSRRHVPEVPF